MCVCVCACRCINQICICQLENNFSLWLSFVQDKNEQDKGTFTIVCSFCSESCSVLCQLPVLQGTNKAICEQMTHPHSVLSVAGWGEQHR